jgi:quinol monooxygenase YgiN
MYENSVTLRAANGQQDTLLALLRETIVPLLKSQAGLVSLGLVPQPDRQRVTILSEWRREEDARAAERVAGYWCCLHKLEPYLADEPVRILLDNN